MGAKVTKEFYRLVRREGIDLKILKTYEAYSDDMFYDAFLYAGEHRVGTEVQRVTTWVSEEELSGIASLFYEVENGVIKGETVTGVFIVSAPGYADTNNSLSRYHPVNGWVIPEEIEIDI